MKDDFATRCLRMVNELQESEEIDAETKVEDNSISQLTRPDWVFNDIAGRTGMHLAPRFSDYFFPYIQIHASWESNSAPEIKGEFCLRHIYRCLTSRQGALQDSSLSASDQEMLPDLRIFDEEPAAGSGRVATLRLKPGVENPEVWLYDMRHDRLELLDLDYGSYLETLLATKGTFGWQYLFADVDLRHRRFGNTVRNLEQMLERFPEIFPDYSYGSLRERLEERL